MSRAAKTTFHGNPTDELAAVDVYGEVSPEVQNNFRSKFSAFSADLTTRLGRSQSDLADLASGVKSKEIGLNTARKRLQDVLGGSIKDFQNLPNDLRSRIIDASVVGSAEHNWMMSQVDGVRTIIEGGDFDSAQGIMGVLGGLTKNPIFDVVGLGPVMGLIQVGLEELAKWEIPELVDDLMSYLDSSPQSVKDQVVRDASRRLGPAIDLDTLKALLKHVDGSILLAENPMFVEQFLQAYMIPYGKDASQYSGIRVDLVEVLTEIRADWLYLDRNGESCFNIRVLSYCSQDAILILGTDLDLIGGVVPAGEYRQHNPLLLARQMYPLAVF